MARNGLSRLPREPQPERSHKPFRDYEPGFLHVDVKYLPQMADETKHRYLFVAIDRATRWVFIQLKSRKTAAAAKSFLAALGKACPVKIHNLLTDNGKEFTSKVCAPREKKSASDHEFDRLCQAPGIKHRLTGVRTPQTNGMVERFNGRIAEILATHRFTDSRDLAATLHRYVWLYNYQLPHL